MILLFAIGIAAGCSKKDDPVPEADKYTGDPYMGTVDLLIKSSDPDADYQSASGDASGFFKTTEDGKSIMTVSGSIGDGDGNTGFSMDGSYQGDRWVGDPSDLNLDFKIDENGTISGTASTEGIEFPQNFTFKGNITEYDLNLRVETEVLRATEGGFPAGTVFSFNYILSRNVDSNGNKKGDNSDGGCENVRWELRNVWTGGVTLSLIRVPVCY